jgi:hypothetical protein
MDLGHAQLFDIGRKAKAENRKQKTEGGRRKVQDMASGPGESG